MQPNTPSPLIPQGTFLNQKGRSHIRIAVFTILAIHVVVLGALLLQGCKRTTDTNARQAEDTNEMYTAWPSPDLPPLEPIVTNTPAPTSTFVPPPPPAPPFVNSSAVTPPPPTSAPPSSTFLPEEPTIPAPPLPPPSTTTTVVEEEAPPASTGTEHVIVQGETFAGLSQKYGVTVQAIANANPNVDPRRLQIGQKIFIPAAPPSTGETSASSDSGQQYVVKSGDTLTRIAGKFGTTVRALRSANNLSTDRIVVGQKLAIPNGSP